MSTNDNDDNEIPDTHNGAQNFGQIYQEKRLSQCYQVILF